MFANYETKDQKTIIRKLINLLIINEHLSSIERKKAVKYLADNKFKNKKEYKKIQSTLPGPLPGRSLADFPEMVKDWYYEKNYPLTPNLFSIQSHQKVWWKCEKGHEYKDRIQNRVNKVGSGCGPCLLIEKGLRRSIAIAENGRSIADKCPNVIKEWHPQKNGERTPYNVPVSSNINAWWICSKGHEYDMIVSRKTGDRKVGCPYCSNMRVGKDNNLSFLYKNLAKEWHPTKNGKLKPSDVVPGTPKKVWWKCPNNHEYEKQVRHRAIFGSNCPFCSGRKVCNDNNLEILFPEIAEQWHPIKNGDKKPSDYTRGSDAYAWWICKKGHEWRTKILHRTISKSGCPICAKRRKMRIEGI